MYRELCIRWGCIVTVWGCVVTVWGCVVTIKMGLYSYSVGLCIVRPTVWDCV